MGDLSGVGQEVVFRILGGHAALDCIPTRLRHHVGNPHRRERMPLGDPDLGLYEVDTHHELGDRVLHLDARVHFDEVEVAAWFQQELDGSSTLIAGVDHEVLRRRADSVADLRVQAPRRGRLHHLLMATLDRAVPLPQMLYATVPVRQNLNLDVARVPDQSLDVDVPLPECTGRLAACDRKHPLELFCASSDAHASTAASRHGLHHNRISRLVGE